MTDNNIHRANKRGMVLAIDMGNTNIVIGCIDDDKVYFEERLATDLKKTELEYVVLIKTVLELYGIDSSQISGAIISSVVPQLVNIIREAVEKLIDITPMVVGPGVKTGLNIHMDEPRRVGSDLIVDMGTATTISIVDDKGSYAGGVILPGIRVSVDALASRTAQLPRISLEAPGHVIGKNTLDCMKSGVVYGNASCIDGMIDRMADEIGIPLASKENPHGIKVVATGGLSRVIVPECRHDIIVDHALLLKGLKIIYDKNVE